MTADRMKEIEIIQKTVARTIAVQPVGRNLALIGGFRYRFLDESVRVSDDIDYHWGGDLDEKQNELIRFFRRVLLPQVLSRFGYSGNAEARPGPDADSPFVRIVDLAFWKENTPFSRIEIPVELTRIVCLDPIAIRTADGTIYATVSDGDMIESKVIAILNRINMRHRDLVDVFLFQNCFLSNSGERLTAKLNTLNITSPDVKKRISDLQVNSNYHARAVQEVIDTQLNTEAADQINDAGGGKMLLDTVVNLLEQYIL